MAVAAVGLFVYGIGTGTWDVAMNVEGAAVERELGRAIMPRFHAGWSFGSVAGAGLGVLVTAVGVPMTGHLALAALVALLALRGHPHVPARGARRSPRLRRCGPGGSRGRWRSG